MFAGQLKSTLNCTTCNYKSSTFEAFWQLAVPIPIKVSFDVRFCIMFVTLKDNNSLFKFKNQPIKLDDCLRHFMAEEILDGENKPVNKKTISK